MFFVKLEMLKANYLEDDKKSFQLVFPNYSTFDYPGSW